MSDTLLEESSPMGRRNDIIACSVAYILFLQTTVVVIYTTKMVGSVHAGYPTAMIGVEMCSSYACAS